MDKGEGGHCYFMVYILGFKEFEKGPMVLSMVVGPSSLMQVTHFIPRICCRPISNLQSGSGQRHSLCHL